MCCEGLYRSGAQQSPLVRAKLSHISRLKIMVGKRGGAGALGGGKSMGVKKKELLF